MRIRYLVWLAAFFALALPNPGWGYTFITNNGTNVTWPAGPIAMKIMADNTVVLSDGTTRAGSIQAAMQTWNAVLGTVQFTSQIQTAGDGTDGNSVNEIFFSNTAYGDAWDSSTLAVTTEWLNTNNSQRLEADIIFNTNFTWDSYRGSLRTPEDIRRVVLHELGHVLGLGHPDLANPPQSVNAIMNSAESDVDTLQADDIAGAQVLYGSPNVAPNFYSQPSAQTIYAGQSVSFAAGASGSPAPNYKWQRQPAGSSTWSNLSDAGAYSGTGTGTLTIAATTTVMNGDKFRCVATNSVGSATSNAVLLTVNAIVAPTIAQQPASLSVTQGSAVNFSVSATGTSPLAYQWYLNGQSISGATNSALAIYKVQPANAGAYTVVVSNAGGSAISTAAILTVNLASGAIFGCAGGADSFQTDSDGILWSVGSNTFGELGDGTTTNWNYPVQIDTGVVAVVAKSSHSLFLKSDESLRGMGDNMYGTLGDGTNGSRSTPGQIATGVVAVSTGQYHSLFIKADGTLWGMGWAADGELGNPGGGIQLNFPVQIATRVMAASAGFSFSLFIDSQGNLWGMGYNSIGELGDGTTTEHHTPVSIASGVVAVSAGGNHSLFIKSDGTLWAMGYNNYGQLGDGTNIERDSPVQISTGVVAASAGNSCSLFIKSDGTLWAMGNNNYGQLGDGTDVQRNSPVQVATGVVAASAGEDHSVFTKSDGTFWAMGNNYSGQLGDGTNTTRLSPVQVFSAPLSAPTIPVSLNAGLTTYPGEVLLSWNPTIGATSYEVWRNTSNDSNTATRIASAVPISLFYDLSPLPGTNYYWIKAMNPAGASSLSAPASIVITSAPVLTQQPSSQTVTVGSPVTFTAMAGGTPAPTYQWQKNGVNIPGATNNTFTIASTVTGDAGSYTVMATNVVGSVASAAATLTVNVPPAITAQPPAGQTIIAGNSVTFTATASGSPAPTYQWQKNGADIPGATGDSYTIANVSLGDAGSYTVVVTNVAGTITSNADVLTVHAPPVFTAQPGSEYVTVGAHVSFTFTTTGNPTPTYQWKKGGVDIPGATSATLALNNVQLTDAGNYTVLATNSVSATVSSIALLNVVTAPLNPVPRDFNNDGQTDILWRNMANGNVSAWFMNGTTMQGSLILANVTQNWQVAGVGDFDGDGQTDILWRNNVNGNVSVWLMNGTAIQSQVMVATGIAPNWQIAGTGDFDGDGQVDIVWHNSVNGNVSVWLMNGTAIQSQVTVATGISQNWQIVGTGDFDGDGQSDILWRNNVNGNVSVWLMNGTAIQSQVTVATGVSPNWQIADTGDFDSDGQVDILWHNSVNGNVSIWLMDGTAVQSQVMIATGVSQNWQIAK